MHSAGTYTAFAERLERREGDPYLFANELLELASFTRKRD
jgi:hypothetical protein